MSETAFPSNCTIIAASPIGPWAGHKRHLEDGQLPGSNDFAFVFVDLQLSRSLVMAVLFCLQATDPLTPSFLFRSFRRPPLPPRNQISSNIKRSVWTWWMGLGTTKRDDGRSSNRLEGMGVGMSRSVSTPSLTRETTNAELKDYGSSLSLSLVAVARGEQEYFDPSGIPTAAEACKSNALMRCCKDLGIASELWDPSFIRSFKSKYCHEAFVEHATTKKK